MKLGLIKVTGAAINDGFLPEIFYRLGITPIEIFTEQDTCLKIYKCIGECFDDVPEGNCIKEYHPTISRDNDDNLVVTI